MTRPDETGLVTDQSSLEVEPLDDLEDAPGAPRTLPRAAPLPRTLFGGSDVQGLREREDRLLVQAERSQQRAAKHVQICTPAGQRLVAVVAAHVDLVIQESDRRAVEPGFLRDPGASEQHVEAQATEQRRCRVLQASLRVVEGQQGAKEITVFGQVARMPGQQARPLERRAGVSSPCQPCDHRSLEGDSLEPRRASEELPQHIDRPLGTAP